LETLLKEFHFVVTLNTTQKAFIVVTSRDTKAGNEEFPSMGFTSGSIDILDYYREGFLLELSPILDGIWFFWK
jgi:hypothetical protein